MFHLNHMSNMSKIKDFWNMLTNNNSIDHKNPKTEPSSPTQSVDHAESNTTPNNTQTIGNSRRFIGKEKRTDLKNGGTLQHGPGAEWEVGKWICTLRIRLS